MIKIKKKDSSAILNSLSGGVVPNRGLQYILVGRVEETKQIVQDLKIVKEGDSLIKFFIGAFGTGKSFIQALIKQVGFDEKFVVTNADFTPERRLYGNSNQAISLYNELVKNLSTKTIQDGNALPTIIDLWITDIQELVAKEKKYDEINIDDMQFVMEVEDEIAKIISNMDELTGGYDFAQVLKLYYRGFVEGDTALQRNTLRWLRGEYLTKTDALRDLGVRQLINDNNYYEYLKVICKFVKQIGYSGLIINLDEAINLYKITHTQAREKNYETILKIFNDILQSNIEGLYITFSGTTEFLEDDRRGLYSYQALNRRLVSKFDHIKYRDLTQPVIKLTPLQIEETFVLLLKLRDIHSVYYQYKPQITDKEIEQFVKHSYKRPGADKHFVIGNTIREFLNGLNILQQNPNARVTEVFTGVFNNNEQDAKNIIQIKNRFQKSSF